LDDQSNSPEHDQRSPPSRISSNSAKLRSARPAELDWGRTEKLVLLEDAQPSARLDFDPWAEASGRDDDEFTFGVDHPFLDAKQATDELIIADQRRERREASSSSSG
jgi:hypothetical protein